MANSKVEKAFTAMKALGIPPEAVKPVLRKLFYLYDRSWDFIEAENYRALADAIFECKEDQVVKFKRKNPLDDEYSKPPWKKLCKGQEKGRASSTEASALVIYKDGRNVPALDAGTTVPSQSHSQERRLKSCSQLSSVVLLDERHCNNAHAVKQTTESTSSLACSELRVNLFSSVQPDREKILQGKQDAECQVNRSCTMQQEREKLHGVKHNAGCQLNGSTSAQTERGEIPGSKQTAQCLDAGSSCSTLTSKRILSGHSQPPCSSSLTDLSTKSGSCSVDKENKDYGSGTHNSCGTCRKFSISSSCSGSVKLSFDCDSSLGQLRFHAWDVDSVLKFMEEKIHGRHNVVGTPFCLKKLLVDMCNCFLELVSDSSHSRAAAKSFQAIRGDVQSNTMRSSKEVYSVGRTEDVPTKKAISMNQKKEPFYFIDDITKGEEKLKISLVDESGKGDRPNFYYIPKNLIYQNAHVNISLARISDDDCCSNCSSDCLSAPVPCACARETGGEFAYTPEGLLQKEFLRTCISMNDEPEKHHLFYCQDCPLKRSKDEPCRGHLIRRFIKECWSKCGCDMHCGNRVVQRGINRNLQVCWTTERKGWGLRALEDLPVGAFVCEYVGEVLTNTELYERNLRSTGNARHTYPVQLDADWGSESILEDEELLCLDATFYGNVARFINHRCHDANLLEIPVEVETLDHHYYHLAFFTKREVKALDELTWDYQIDFDDHEHPIKAFQCCCGSAFCRDKSRKSKGKGKALG